MPPERPSIWSHDSNETASGKPGTLQWSVSRTLNGSHLDPNINPLTGVALRYFTPRSAPNVLTTDRKFALARLRSG